MVQSPSSETITQLVKKFPAFYGIRRFITMFTRANHLSLSRARWTQPVPPHPISLRFILILSSHPCLGLLSGFFPNSDAKCNISLRNCFYGHELLAPRPTPKLEDHPFIGCPLGLIQYIRSHPPYVEGAPCRGDKIPW